MRVINECRIDFAYKLSPDYPSVTKTIISNKAITDIIKKSIKVCKFVDKKVTCEFDILTYKIVIYNISECKIGNVFLKDNLSIQTKFIPNSVYVNNIKKQCENPMIGICLGDLEANSEITIEFKVVVVPTCCYNHIINRCSAWYDHVYNVEERPDKLHEYSNDTNTFIKYKVFKSIDIMNTLCISKDIVDIEDVCADVDIIDIKKSENLFEVDGICSFELIVIGSINYNIEYSFTNNSKKISTENIQKTYGFSTLMSIPIGIIYDDVYKIKIKIENISIDSMCGNELLISSSILLYY